MKRIFAPLFFLLLLLFPACSSIENPAEVPYDHSALVGMDYDEALSVLKGAGFVNIESTERSTKNIDHNNKISAISIDGNTTFSKGKVWENDVPVEISYFALEQLDVTIDIETGGEDGKPVFAVKTNLPDKAELTLALQDDDMYFEQQTVIVKNGAAESEPFTNGGVALYGHCTLTVVMEPAQQPGGVQRVVGDDGRLLTGELIEASPDGGSYVFYECSYDSPYKSESDIPPESLSLGDLYTAIGITLSSSFGEN